MWSALGAIQTFFIWLMYSIMIIILVLIAHKVNQYARLIDRFMKKVGEDHERGEESIDIYTVFISSVIVLTMMYGFWVFMRGVIDYDNRMLVGDFAGLFLGELLRLAIVGIVVATFLSIMFRYMDDLEADKDE